MQSLRVTSSLSFRPLLSSMRRSDCCSHRGYRKQEPFAPRTMNDLPVPRGSWQRHYDQKQQRYNRYLLGSLGVFGITTYYLVTTDMLIWGLPNLKEMNISSEPIVKKQRPDDALRETGGEFSSSFGDKLTTHEAKPVTLSSDEAEVDARLTKTTKTATENPTKTSNSTDVVIQKSGESSTSGEFLNIPAHVPYLLIGGGTASFAAFRAIKGGDAKAKVLVISEEPHYPYMRPPLSKELWFSEDETIRETLKFKQWNGRDRSVFFEPAEFFCKPSELSSRENGGVAVVTSHRVTKLDVEQQIAHLDDGTMISYDKCLVATGGRPRRLEALDGVSDHVTYFRNIDNYRRLEKVTDHVKSVVVLGGGFLGSELACALAAKATRKPFEVVQTYPEKGNLAKVLPEYLSKWTTHKVADEGVRVVPEVRVTRAEMTADGRVRLTLDNADTLVTDHVVVAVGLEPNTELADSSRLELDAKHGGFRVNAELEARTNLWVAGDAACFYDVQLGRRRVEHHDHAVVSGRLAGENMTGAGKPYTHQSMFWSDLGPEVGFEAIGLVDNILPTVAVFAQATAEDTPKAAVETSGEAVRSEMERKSVSGAVKKPALSQQGQGKEDIGKGVVFYTKHDVIVGVVMWNVFNKMHVARQIIKEGRPSEEARGLAKLFGLYDEAK